MALHLIALHVIPSHCPESHPRALHRPGGSSWLRVTSHRSTSHCLALHPHLAASCTLLYPTSLHGSTMPTGRRVLGSGCPLPACSGPRHPPAPAAGAAHPSLPAPPGAVIPTPCRGPPALLCVSHIHHPSHPQITPALLTRLPRDAGILQAPLHTPLIAILFNYWANYWKQQHRGPEPQALLQKKSFQLAGSAHLCRLLPPAAPPAPAIPLPRCDAIWKLSAPASSRHY